MIILWIFLGGICFGSENGASNILDQQKETFGINSFIKEVNKYTEEGFDELNIDDIFNSAMKGELNVKNVGYRLLGFFEKDFLDCTKTIRGYIMCYNYT
ncbi:MAG: hypothetical protein Q4G05_03775 [Clostridia bacterium]|nr:hypothetical protein [Clostridia bacterium]